MASIKDWLAEATNTLDDSSGSAALDAEVLLCWLLNKNRSFLRAWPEFELDKATARQFSQTVNERKQGKPIAYLTGKREFWSRDFIINNTVLIPRPETELLVELSLALINPSQAQQIIDLGTGSGIIAITLGLECPLAQIYAVDASPVALATAQQNAKLHSASNIRFYLSDWFDAVPEGLFDLVVSNPPYIDALDEHLQQGDVRFEPASALIAAQQGLGDLINIADTARKRLKPSGHVLLEHGYNQAAAVQTLLVEYGYHSVQTRLDLAGQPRVTIGQWHG